MLVASLVLAGCHRGQATSELTLGFEARLNGAPFSCESSNPFHLTDLRLFLHDFRLVAADGQRTSLQLREDGIWQSGGAVLLDFEDSSGVCKNGTLETHTQVTGLTRTTNFTAVEFRLGLPFEVNHRNPDKAPSPLNLTTMHWNWLGGYKFLRLGAQLADGRGYRAHLGSTGCDGTIGAMTGCRHENRALFRVEGISDGEGGTRTIIFDVDRLLRGSDAVDASASTEDHGSLGCMAEDDDPGCRAIFENLGLPSSFNANPPPATVFYVP